MDFHIFNYIYYYLVSYKFRIDLNLQLGIALHEIFSQSAESEARKVTPMSVKFFLYVFSSTVVIVDQSAL